MERKAANEIGRMHHVILRALDARVMAVTNKEVTVVQARLIGYVGREAQVFQRDIEQAFGLSRSSVSLMLDNMQKHNLIARKAVEGDARLKQIVLTEKSHALYAQLQQVMEQFERDLTQGIDAQSLDLVVSILQHMHENVREG